MTGFSARTRDTGGVAAAARALLGPTATVTDIADVRARIGSSLTAVDLTQLARVELGFALALAVAADGLVSALGWPSGAAPPRSPAR